MLAQRLLRIVPGRSQLMIVIGVAITLLVVVIFVDLTLEKNKTFARLQRARGKVDLLQEQNARLEREMGRLKEGQGLGLWAWLYYGWTLPEVSVAIPEATAGDAQPGEAQP